MCAALGRTSEALTKTTELTRLAPRDYFALVLHGRALRGEGRLIEALDAFSAASKVHQLCMEDMHQYAIAALRYNRLEDAIKYFGKVRSGAEF